MEILTKGVKSCNVFVGVNQRDGADVFFTFLEFEEDLTPVHPYIHARTAACRHRTNPHYARFYWKGKECVLYEKSCLAGIFEDRGEAEAFGPGLVNLINEVYKHRSDILPAEPNREPLKALDILRLLPRINCGKCGLQTCLAFSVAVAREQFDPWACPYFPKPRKGRAAYVIEGMDQPLIVNLDGERSQPKGVADETGNISALTHRELQVLELMALGFSNKEIAENLEISPHTVKTHTVHIFEKLDCTDRAQASVWASRAGLV